MYEILHFKNIVRILFNSNIIVLEQYIISINIYHIDID